jgi:hypothetical protein
MEQKIVKFNGFSQFYKNRHRNKKILKEWNDRYNKPRYAYVTKEEEIKQFTIDEDKIKL